jgi:hypothetical protein
MMEIIIESEIVQLLTAFMPKARDDPRIGPAHISLYMALLCLWYEKKGEDPLYIFSHELMPLCKLAGLATYHRSIRELSQYGYIKYVPSYNQYLGSLVYLKNE